MHITKSLRSLAGAAVAAATLGSSLLAGAPSAAAYAPGSASAAKPGYSVSLWSKLYSCAYAGWAAVPKGWQCSLKNVSGYVVSSHNGTFDTTTGYNTSTYYYQTPNAYFCTLAYAGYADGSASDSDQKCA